MNRQAQFENSNDQQSGGGIKLDDIYFTIFRHKFLLLTFLLLAFAGSIAVRLINKPLYSSHAKLLVRYVINTIDVNPLNKEGSSIREGDSSAESVLNSEAQILTSQDLAWKVVQAVGPKRILGEKGDATNLVDAAKVVSKGVVVVTPSRSDTIIVGFEHPDRTVVQPVLNALIRAYLDLHKEVHHSTGFSQDYYSDQLAQDRKRLATIEAEIKLVLTQHRVISIDDAKRTYTTQIEKLKADLLAAKADLYSRKAVLGEDTNSNESSANSEVSIPAEELENYAALLAGLDQLAKRERELSIQGLTSVHPSVIAVRESIADLKRKKVELENTYPGIMLSDSAPAAGLDITVERAQIRALTAKVETYENLLTNLETEAISLLTVEPKIAELERQRQQEAKNLEYVSASLDRARSQAVEGDKVTGINVVENPTVPERNSKKIHKMMVMAFGAILGLGLGLAALIDFVIDRTIKRPSDVRRHIDFPLFLTIPKTEPNGRHSSKALLPRETGTDRSPESAESRNDVALTTLEQAHFQKSSLRTYAEGLCERLITHFEVNGLIHKPKLVGITSCGSGAGVSTLASGMAAALSKTGDGNVLLVDMNIGPGAIHSFHQGRPGCGLSEALEPERRAEAKIDGNLYHVAMGTGDTNNGKANGDESAGRMVPARLKNIMPRLKASDYDFIIFDLPPVTPTSVTPRLASNMDMVLLVLESEKTAQQPASQASMLLTEAHANVAVVLNKHRKHVPAMLSQEL